MQNHLEIFKNPILNPKHAKIDQQSEIGHVRTCQDLSRRTSTYCKPAEIFLFFQILHLSILLVFSWLHKLRNTQGKIYGTSLENIYRRRLYFWLSYIINIYGYSLYIPYTFHIYIYMFPKYVPYVFPCVCSSFIQSTVGPDMTEVRFWVKVRTLRFQNWLFEVIS